jgi:hypothetical protein
MPRGTGTSRTDALLKETILEIMRQQELARKLVATARVVSKEKDRLHDAPGRLKRKREQPSHSGGSVSMQRLCLDKMAAECQVSQLKSRVAGLNVLMDAAASGGGLVCSGCFEQHQRRSVAFALVLASLTICAVVLVAVSGGF